MQLFILPSHRAHRLWISWFWRQEKKYLPSVNTSKDFTRWKRERSLADISMIFVSRHTSPLLTHVRVPTAKSASRTGYCLCNINARRIAEEWGEKAQRRKNGDERRVWPSPRGWLSSLCHITAANVSHGLLDRDYGAENSQHPGEGTLETSFNYLPRT